jgi:signal transduction histidine kinase
MVLPMVDRLRTVGVLVLRTARSIVGFTEEEISFCQMVANVATSALKMSALRQAEQKNNVVVLGSGCDPDGQSGRERSALLGMAAHDLRVLVSVVDGYCLLLSETEGENLSLEQNEIMGGLMSGSRRLVDMANNLLDYSRIEAGRFELKMAEQDICSILKMVHSEIVPLLRKRSIHMEVNCLCNAVPIICDEEGIRRVFYNIVSNALKFTPNGGTIKLSLIDSKDEARVSIDDSGPGIEPEVLAHLFDEYVCSASPDGQPGNGLGLAICKKIIEAHHGRIWAESSLGQGSRFTFCLPK